MTQESTSCGSQPVPAPLEDERPQIGWEILFVAAICLAGFALRVWRIGEQSLWIDEIYTIQRTANESWLELWKRPDCVMFWFQKASFTIFPHTDAFFRLPSAISGMLALAAMYLVGRELLGRSVAVVASLLLCFAPMHIYFSQDARHYAHQTFFTLLGTWFLIRAVRHRHWYDWVGFACLGLLNVLNHAVGLVIVGLQLGAGFLMGVVLVLESDAPRAKRFVRVALFLVLPLLVCSLFVFGLYGLKSPDKVTQILQIAGVAPVDGANKVFALQTSPVDFDGPQWLWESCRVFGATAWYWIPLVFLAAGLGYPLWRRRSAAAVLLVLGVLPLVAVAVLPLHWYPMKRYFLWNLPFFHLIEANGIVVLVALARFLPAKRPVRRLLQVSLVGIVLIGLYGVGGRRILSKAYTKEKGHDWRYLAELLREQEPPHWDWRLPAKTLKEQHIPGEIVLIEGQRMYRQSIRVALAHYLRFGEPRTVQCSPKIMDFPGARQLDSLWTTRPTAWRVRRIPTRQVVSRSALGGGVFPGFQIQRFMLKSPRSIPVPNGSFELDTGTWSSAYGPAFLSGIYDSAAGNGIPDGWRQSGRGRIGIKIDEQVHCRDGKSLWIGLKHPRSGCQLESVPIGARPGYLYEASVRVRVQGKATIKVWLTFLDHRLEPLLTRAVRPTGDNDDWETYRVFDPRGHAECFVTPAGTVAVSLTLRVEQPVPPGAQVWFDDARLSGAWPAGEAREDMHRTLKARQSVLAPSN